jgi:uncharacterized integral membrane protein
LPVVREADATGVGYADGEEGYTFGMSEALPPPRPPAPPAAKADKPVPWRLIGAAFAIVLIVVFLAENTRTVPIRFVGPVVHTSLIVALLIAALLGSAATLLIQHHRAKGEAKRRR